MAMKKIAKRAHSAPERPTTGRRVAALEAVTSANAKDAGAALVKGSGAALVKGSGAALVKGSGAALVKGSGAALVKEGAVADKPRVRDRILETAGDLFYARGIHCVGVDSIASEAGTNKMSLYRNFPSKEELIAEYLRQQEHEYWAVWDATVAPHRDDPRRQLEALFDGFLARAKQSRACDEDECKVSRGCALGNAAVEISEEDEALRSIVLTYKSELRRRLRRLAKDAGAREPDALGDALMLLLEGGCYTLATFPGVTGPIAALAKGARALIRAHLDEG